MTKKSKIDHYSDKEALDFHINGKSGKIEVNSSKPLTTKRDLSLAYSPGVAAPVKEISKNPETAYDYTSKGNLVAVISNGSAILGLGKLGGCELSADSDLDIMVVYQADREMSEGERPIGCDTWFSRFTQRLVAALSAPTEEGDLFDVDLALRPSGSAGPVAVSLARFESYYQGGEAWTWERMALTRARIVGGQGLERVPKELGPASLDVLLAGDSEAKARQHQDRWEVLSSSSSQILVGQLRPGLPREAKRDRLYQGLGWIRMRRLDLAGWNSLRPLGACSSQPFGTASRRQISLVAGPG